MVIKVDGATDIGKQRDTNEDAYGIVNLSNKIHISNKCMIVADGVGGHNGGEIASKKAVELYKEFMQSYDYGDNNLEKYLKDIILQINSTIYNLKMQRFQQKNLCTTLSSLVLYARKYYIGHVGDSRIYLYRDGKLRQLTRDHSAVQDAVDKGTLTVKEAENHPGKSVITRAIGFQESVQVDISKGFLKDNDVFLLCSDGLSGLVDKNDILSSLKHAKNPLKTCKELIRKANKNGGSDNITLIISIIKDPDHSNKSVLRFLPFFKKDSCESSTQGAPSTLTDE